MLGGNSDAAGDEATATRTAKHRNLPARLSSRAAILRSASYTYIAQARQQERSHPAATRIEEKVHASVRVSDLDATSPDSSGIATPEESHFAPECHSHQRDLAAELHRNSKIRAAAASNGVTQDSRSSLDSRLTDCSFDSTCNISTAATTPVANTPRGSIISFSRKLKHRSWVEASSQSDSSRSPSPHKLSHHATGQVEVGAEGTVEPVSTERKSRSRRMSFGLRKSTDKPAKDRRNSHHGALAFEQPPSPPQRKPSLITRRRSRSRTSQTHALPSLENMPPVKLTPSIPKSLSSDRLPLKSLQPIPSVPMPKLSASDKHVGAGLAIPKKKDPLWNAFRDLDSEFIKFTSKTLAFKTNVVRSSLLPFLRDQAQNPSNWNLRPEDLDRRTNILNKWWTGLIEMLNGCNNRSIAGTDRFAVLDAAVGIMQRPEWRLAPSPFSPLAQREGEQQNKSQSQTSGSTVSANTDFLADSVHHNVRNTFIQNLIAQVVFVVDKMSLRNAPASLVTFCGKACAYAFMFVPGMADVLVRLWDLPVDAIRRVVQEGGVGRCEDISTETVRLASHFPPALRTLAFTSLETCMKTLRTPPPLPLGTASVTWWGQWLERWSGRESDLFYVFVKHFHILLTEFLPEQTTRRERVSAPAFVLVQAQILVNLDATIHRKLLTTAHDTINTSSPTFDDIFAGPDAIAAAVPLAPTNAVRIMAENRLIMLIRDFLSERAVQRPAARRLFAESFNDVLQAAVRGTSVFDHTASYTLLDFLEEALQLLVRYERLKETDELLIDVKFWRIVSLKMIESHNTMTEIRLYSFWYTVWSAMVGDSKRRIEICMNFLLDPDVFQSRFNHWCPMVRAYYMRLLCWRLARCDVDPSLEDLDILEALLMRLQVTWSYYLHLRETAEMAGRVLPASTPCSPAPGRKLVIVRTDGPGLRHSPLLDSDSTFQRSKGQSGLAMPVSSKRMSTLSILIDEETRPNSSRSTSDESESSPKSSYSSVSGFLRGLVGAKTRSRSPSPSPSVASTHSSRLKSLPRAGTDDPQCQRDHAPRSESPLPFAAPTHQSCSFRFSLEPHPSHLPPNFQTPKIKFQAHPQPQVSHHLPTPEQQQNQASRSIRLRAPRLPLHAHRALQERDSPAIRAMASARALELSAEHVQHGRYIGRALAEWHLVLAEYQGFFARREADGVPNPRAVETPVLGIEVLRRH